MDVRPLLPLHPSHGRWPRLAWLTLFISVNALLAIGITLGNIPLADNPGGALALSWLGIALPGHFLFFGAALALPPLALSVLRRPHWMIGSAVFLQVLWLCLLLVDAKVFALYRFHLNAMVLNMVFGGALQDQVALSLTTWLQLAGVLLVIIAAQLLLAWACLRLLPLRPRRRAVLAGWTAAACIMLGGQLLTMYHDARGERAVISQWGYLPWAQPITAKRFMRRFGVVAPANAQARLPDVRLSALDYPRQPLRCQSGTRPNVLMVVLESLRSDMLDPRYMPNTAALAGESQVFTKHLSSGNATRYGLFGLMYGLPGGYWQSMLAEQRGSVLLEQLEHQGYQLNILGSAPLYSPEFDRTVFAQVRDRIRTAPSTMKVAERDQWVVDQMRDGIKQAGPDTAWFGFAFLDATHAPYHLPKGYPAVATPMAPSVEFLSLDNDHDATPEFNRYRTAVHYADGLVGQLLDALREQGVLDNTIVLVTGDHGEEFNDLKLNYWGHNGNFSDAQLHVPFVLHWPGKAPATVDATTSHEDWVPTLMRHGMGCENDTADFSSGQDLFGEHAATRALMVESWSQRGIRHGERTYLFDKYGNSSVVDARYRPLPDAEPDPKAVRSSWDWLTRFRK